MLQILVCLLLNFSHNNAGVTRIEYHGSAIWVTLPPYLKCGELQACEFKPLTVTGLSNAQNDHLPVMLSRISTRFAFKGPLQRTAPCSLTGRCLARSRPAFHSRFDRGNSQWSPNSKSPEPPTGPSSKDSSAAPDVSGFVSLATGKAVWEDNPSDYVIPEGIQQYERMIADHQLLVAFLSQASGPFFESTSANWRPTLPNLTEWWNLWKCI
jgi:hypothetical protein